jgi:hypothetical protein
MATSSKATSELCRRLAFAVTVKSIYSQVLEDSRSDLQMLGMRARYLRRAFHVRTSASPAEGPDSKAPEADYGGRPLPRLTWFDRESCCWRTWQHSLFGGWTLFSGRWPRSGMTHNGIAYRLPTLARRTSGTGCGLWVGTPGGEAMAKDAVRSEEFRKGRTPSPQEAARMWATPSAADSVGTTGGGQGKSLRTDVRMWPTPKEQDSRGGSGQNVQGGPSLTDAARMFPTPTTRDWKDGTAKSCANVPVNSLLGRHVHQGQQDNGGRLNPTWVEWLMGYPLAWTDLKPSATPSCPKLSNT